ncbi:hypothetical protein L1987_17253 [Smallanthus sonchifolius]|uniref:Uncharacterized protein n=1 Tax=Smallanthus sonchifolius TaxID=185202 RepID=A0ACB9IWD3_9ASTR|nr:hypothetical protein L1987_17253 [Smallanthus sonchifolius]
MEVCRSSNFPFSSGANNFFSIIYQNEFFLVCSTLLFSVERILSRYEQRCLEAGEITTNGAGEDLCKRFRTCKELLQTVDRFAEENNHEELSVNDMTQLEHELDAALVQTRLRKVIIFNSVPRLFYCYTVIIFWMDAKYGDVDHYRERNVHSSPVSIMEMFVGKLFTHSNHVYMTTPIVVVHTLVRQCKAGQDARLGPMEACMPSARHKCELNNTLHGYD